MSTAIDLGVSLGVAFAVSAVTWLTLVVIGFGSDTDASDRRSDVSEPHVESVEGAESAREGLR